MKKSVKILIAVIVLLLAVGGGVFAFINANSYGENRKAEVVLITNGNDIENDSKINGLWLGVKKYAKNNKMKSNYLMPKLDESSKLETKAIGECIEIAVNNGAKYIVLPDEQFSVASYEYGPIYKDVKFLLVDALPHSNGDDTMRTLSNVMPVKFNVLQAGFLAGYSSVQDGYTKLGFIGSKDDTETGDYSGGFKQGATFAAQEMGKEISFDYAEYDSLGISYDYSLIAVPIYEPVTEDAHKLEVVDGIGSGYYKEGQTITLIANDCEKDKIFDHWDVKDVNGNTVETSDANLGTINVTMSDIDLIATAVYKDAKTQEVTIQYEDGKIYKKYNVPENTTVKIEAPVPNVFYEFAGWECNYNAALDNKESKNVNLTVEDKPIVLTAKYNIISGQVFNTAVMNGSGSGSYKLGDKVKLQANNANDGEMFSKWEIKDVKGNEIQENFDFTNPNLTFDMPNRFGAIVDEFYDKGIELVFTNDDMIAEIAIDKANSSTDKKVFTTNYVSDENQNFIGYVKYDYVNIVSLAFDNFVGGSIYSGNVKNECVSLSNKAAKAKSKNENGKEQVNENYNEDYSLVYSKLGENKYNIVNVLTGADMSKVSPSKNVEFNYWIN